MSAEAKHRRAQIKQSFLPDMRSESTKIIYKDPMGQGRKKGERISKTTHISKKVKALRKEYISDRMNETRNPRTPKKASAQKKTDLKKSSKLARPNNTPDIWAPDLASISGATYEQGDCHKGVRRGDVGVMPGNSVSAYWKNRDPGGTKFKRSGVHRRPSRKQGKQSVKRRSRRRSLPHFSTEPRKPRAKKNYSNTEATAKGLLRREGARRKSQRKQNSLRNAG